MKLLKSTILFLSLFSSTIWANFDVINSSGNIALQIQQIRSAAPDSVVTTSGVTYKIKNNALYLTQTKSKKGKLKTLLPVTIYLHQLYQVNLTGNSSVTGKINSEHLVVNNFGNGVVQLDGVEGVDKIQGGGKSQMNFSWINNSELTIIASGQAQIHLAGEVGNLIMRLRGKSVVDAQYLRAQDVLVQTHDSAAALVLPINSLRAFAYDHSNIYYYKQPRYLTPSTRSSGNILQLGWRH